METLHIVCETAECENNGQELGWVDVPCDEVDGFYEAYGHGSECNPEDYCPNCKQLGVLQ